MNFISFVVPRQLGSVRFAPESAEPKEAVHVSVRNNTRVTLIKILTTKISRIYNASPHSRHRNVACHVTDKQQQPARHFMKYLHRILVTHVCLCVLCALCAVAANSKISLVLCIIPNILLSVSLSKHHPCMFTCVWPRWNIHFKQESRSRSRSISLPICLFLIAAEEVDGVCNTRYWRWMETSRLISTILPKIDGMKNGPAPTSAR